MDTSLIVVEEEGDALHPPIDKLHLRWRERRAADTSYCLYAEVDHSEDIRIAFYEIEVPFLSHRLLGLEETVEGFALAVDLVIVRIQVLRFGTTKGTGTEGNPLSDGIADGEDDALITEEIDSAFGCVTDDEADFLEVFKAIPFIEEVIHAALSTAITIAYRKVFDDTFGEVAL